jgi:5-methyltetrahydropteroyltriglutamate--homocysteine methyltransferase
MILSYDVGSIPLRARESTILEGARRSLTLLPFLGVSDEAVNAFEEEVVSAFSDKLRAGLAIPNYPQLRDMNGMFLELIGGIEKGESGYITLRTPSARPGSKIAEVDALKRNVAKVRDLTGVDRVRVKACVTGPYTLASFFQVRSPKLFTDLGHSISEIVSNTLFKTRHGELSLLCIDEPVLGFLNDPLIDYGSEGRESIKKAWEEICLTAASRGVETAMHLHNTSDDLFWEVGHLNIVESHVDDPLYTQEITKKRLEEADKFLKASIAVTLFDNLIETHLKGAGFNGDIQQGVGEAWTDIRHGLVDPLTFMEDPTTLKKRLKNIIKRLGVERISYAGPECGVGGWPTYETAMECLRRVSETVKTFNKENP